SHRALAAGMPRFDLFQSLHPSLGYGKEAPVPDADPESPEDPAVHAYRSGFWAIVPVPAAGGEEIQIRARARLAGGGEAAEVIARIPLEDPAPLPASTGAEGSIAVCMATYDP